MKNLMNKRTMRIVSMVMLLVMMFTTSIFATNNTTIEEGLKTGLGNFYDLMKVAGILIAVVVVGFIGLTTIFGGSNAVEKAKQNIGKVILGLALLFLAGIIVVEIAGWFSNVGDAGVFN